jgi:predicted nucleic acid-binding protein
VSIDLDTSVLVALLTNDPLTDRADALLRRRLPDLYVSDFAGAEFASALARRVRAKELDADEARSAFAVLDGWAARATQRIEICASDVASATVFLRRLDVSLRTPDALHIAVAQRLGATLATFDAKMALAAERLGVTVVTE